MRKHYYNSLSEFYSDIRNVAGHAEFDSQLQRDREHFTGLSLSEILKSKFSYQPGVERIRNMAEVKIEADVKIRYFDSFDGYDIDIDRMYSDLDFLINSKRILKVPKTMDVFLNITESGSVNYNALLNKTYTTLRIVDHLESLGVRTSVNVCMPITPCYPGYKKGEQFYIEVNVKKHAESVNLGALCTAISPWFFRHWVFCWIVGRDRRIDTSGIGYVTPMPSDEARKGILIDTGECHTLSEANSFIQSIKLTA